MSTTSSSAVGPVSDRSHLRPQATDSVLAPEVAQDPLLELVLAGHPDSAQHLAGHPREEALDQVRPGAVPGRGHELEAARDGGQVVPRLGGGVHRDVAGHDPRQVAPRVLAVRDPEEPGMVGALVCLARRRVASPAGRSIEARGESVPSLLRPWSRPTAPPWEPGLGRRPGGGVAVPAETGNDRSRNGGTSRVFASMLGSRCSRQRAVLWGSVCTSARMSHAADRRRRRPTKDSSTRVCSREPVHVCLACDAADQA